ncbi:Fatty acid desaturase, type 1 domain and Fatty acid desaturase, type 1, core family-containing protein [Strongyloides ratti]|uniref:Fatty acid desaturase, type 1 domain and Fatty acid desaturase, type 1, core family-containing protein n=1 Tax=Strongyloides ratti TaxID=34506 RepID=A0A090L030_STRRB|nr:Fatty acid desaturase, type 1 domain and Fatty acid desaturase, type 1, core family-containing protein [Strongyloides ratti]CEF60824.1 Fatty acid desaturase, type 1 domain and Fatty acid desaturase, type 1, core family-containing protein [Strongyloides ratti]
MTTITKTVEVNKIIKEQYLSADVEEVQKLNEEAKLKTFKSRIVWRNVFLFGLLHAAALLGAYHLLFCVKWYTVIWTFTCWILSGLGITAGAHRLWSHRCYKAKLPLRICLMFFNSMAIQNDIIEWSRDHRCHHKWTDTDADPHNINRGFFFSHMGWLLEKKHPKVKEMGTKLDLTDLFNDPVCAFQRKYYFPLVIFSCFVFPTWVAVAGWGESAFYAFYTAGVFRYVFTLHATWLINSAAHTFGYKPYDASISPVESVWTDVLAIGEGGHNFHHTFPQDYRASEYGYELNITKLFIDFMQMIGQAYDCKTVTEEVIVRQSANKGECPRLNASKKNN